MKKIIKSSLFKKYIFSYFVMFSIPLIALMLVVNNIYISSVRQEMNTANENYLEQTNNLLNDQMNELRSLANYINETGHFTALSPQRTNQFQNYQEILMQHEHSNGSVEALYIVLNNDDMVFSSRGHMSTEAMFTHATHFQNISGLHRISNMVEETREDLYVSNGRVFYSVPLGGNGSTGYGSILFVMNTAPIRANIESLIDTDKGMSFLMDNDGEIIHSSRLHTDMTFESFFNISPSYLVENETVDLDGTTYLTSSITNDMMGWTFVSLIDTNSFYQPLRNVFVIVGFGLAVLMMTGLLLSYYFAKQNYQPIQNLTSIFDQEVTKNTDELSFLQNNITRTNTEIHELNNLMTEQAPIIRNAALLDLIEGKWDEELSFLDHLNNQVIQFPFDYFGIMIVELGDKSLEADKIYNIEALAQKLNQSQTDDSFHIEAAVPYLRNNQLFVIANLKEDSKKLWGEIVSYIQNELYLGEIKKQHDLKLGIGTTHNTWKRIKNSFIEASSALEELNKKDERKEAILFFDEINHKSETKERLEVLQYPKEGTMLLLQSLKQGQVETAKETIQELFSMIRERNHNNISNQAIIASLFNAVIQTADELGLGSHSQLLFDLDNFADVEQAHILLIQISEKICSDVQEKLECVSNKIEKNVVQYIFENYHSPDISLEQIASENHISISYASKLIKEETGESFSNILQTLRMNRFKELLVTTKTPIKDLVAEVGYYDVSNFTRKFRQENELTPGQYRKKYRNQQLSTV